MNEYAQKEGRIWCVFIVSQEWPGEGLSKFIHPCDSTTHKTWYVVFIDKDCQKDYTTL